MFEYCIREDCSIVNTIGQFLSHKVKWIDEEGNLLECEIINSWDRRLIAERYLEEYFHYPKNDYTYKCIGGSNNKDRFLDEVALKIDEFIPKRYFVKYHQAHNTYGSTDGTVLQTKFINKDHHEVTKKLEYHFNHSFPDYVQQIDSSTVATDKQISYIQSLCKECGYILKEKDNLMCANADEIIKFLTGEIEVISSESYSYLEYE